METEVYKVVDCFKPELAPHEWNHLDAVFNSLGTNDTYRNCGYFGSKSCLKESLEPEEPEEISDQVLWVLNLFLSRKDQFGRQKQEIISYPGLEKLLTTVDETDASAEYLIIWNGR